jgi:hypothetical protein
MPLPLTISFCDVYYPPIGNQRHKILNGGVSRYTSINSWSKLKKIPIGYTIPEKMIYWRNFL